MEKYLWADLTTLLAVYDKDDNLIQRFTYANGRMPISMTQGSNKYYLHYDQVGSLRAVTDSNHNIIKEVIYDSFGNIISDSNESFSVPFGFAGGLYDRDTGLTRFGYRDYDSYTGKWTAKDPIDFSGGDSNLYGYVLNDPINGIDELGLFVSSIGGGGSFNIHLFIGGISVKAHMVVKCDEVYIVTTTCGRIGPGLSIGTGLEFTPGLSPNGGDISDGYSIGVGATINIGSGGVDVGTSFDGENISGAISGKIGPNVGGSMGVDICYSSVKKL